jgi:hypothetical protein
MVWAFLMLGEGISNLAFPGLAVCAPGVLLANSVPGPKVR